MTEEAAGTQGAPQGWRDAAIVAAATVGGFALRLIHLGMQPLWNDEVLTRQAAEARGIENFVYFLHDASPPLYLLLLKAWLILGADSERAIRLLPVLFGAASIPAAYAVLKGIFDRRAALAATVVLAIHPYHLYYSQENRYVTLLTLLGLAVVGAYARFLRRGRWADAALLALAGAAMLYTHYYALFLLAALGLHFVAFRLRTADDLLRVAAIGAAIVLAFLPWLGVFLMQLQRGQPAREVFRPVQQFFLTGSFFLIGGTEWHLPPIPFTHLMPEDRGYVGTMSALLAAVGVLLVVGIVRDLRRRDARGLGTFAALAPILLVTVVSARVPIYRPKYLLPILPMFWGLAATGCAAWRESARWPRRIVATGIAALVLALLAGSAVRVFTDADYQRERWWDPRNWLMAHERAGDVLLLYNPYSASAWRYYYHGNVPLVSVVSPFTRPMVPSREVIDRRIEAIGREYRRVWVLDYQAVVHDPGKTVLAACARRFHEIPYLADARDPRFALRAFATGQEAMEESFARRIDFGEGRYMPEQLLSGLSVNPDGTAWMGREGRVLLRRTQGEGLAQVVFFAHRAFFGDRPVTATLSVEGRPLLERVLNRSDEIVAMTAVVPDDLAGRELLEVALSFDRAFIPDEVLQNGDRTPKTVLVFGFTLLHLGYIAR